VLVGEGVEGTVGEDDLVAAQMGLIAVPLEHADERVDLEARRRAATAAV